MITGGLPKMQKRPANLILFCLLGSHPLYPFNSPVVTPCVRPDVSRRQSPHPFGVLVYAYDQMSCQDSQARAREDRRRKRKREKEGGKRQGARVNEEGRRR
jgi:hypothetical protein